MPREPFAMANAALAASLAMPMAELEVLEVALCNPASVDMDNRTFFGMGFVHTVCYTGTGSVHVYHCISILVIVQDFFHQQYSQKRVMLRTLHFQSFTFSLGTCTKIHEFEVGVILNGCAD